MTTSFIPVDEIRRSSTKKINQKKVLGIMEAYERGEYLPPIRLSRQINGYRIVGDGRHRYEAAVRLGISHILAYIA